MPMYVLIGIWGSRSRKITANYYFFLYTAFGSLFIFAAVLWITCLLGSSSFEALLMYNTAPTLVYKCLPLLFFLGFATKIPMIPFHIWLPEAHVEAPTIGSVILASLLLKLGGYGFMRFNLALFPYAGNNSVVSSFITCLAVVSIIYSSLAAIRQVDIKKIIAYSSIAHMNVVVLALFSNTVQGIDGAVYLMIAHGIASGALFFCIGVMYDRYHTRLLEYYGGLVQVMPIFISLFFLFTLANIGFPLTANFIGEFLSFLGIGQQSLTYLFLAATGVVLSAVYSMWLFGRVSFGSLKVKYMTNFSDLTTDEISIFIPLILAMFALGINSDIVLVFINSNYFIY
jgi:proton-translocating NADH-quinone oxidoreductase chain M